MLSPLAYGQQGTPGMRDGSGTTGTGTTNNSGGAITYPSSGSSSINPAASQGKSSQDMGKMINMATSAAMMAACLEPCPKCQYALCAIGALAALQALAQGEAAGQSGSVKAATDYTGQSTDNGTNNGPGGSSNPINAVDPTGTVEFKEGMKKLKEAGYSVTKEGVTFPDGSVKPASAFSSPGGMAAAGMSPSAIQEAQKILAAVEKDAAKYGAGSVASVPVEGGGGGGSEGNSGANKDGDSDSRYGSYKNPFAVGADQKRKMVAGKTVLFAGEPIGVSGQNIFDMIHDKYQRMRQSNYFIEDDAPSPNKPALPVRAPASKPLNPK